MMARQPAETANDDLDDACSNYTLPTSCHYELTDGDRSHCQTAIETVAVAGNISGDTNSSIDGAVDAIKPVVIKGEDLSIDFFLRFWEGEALSHFRRSAWEGKFRTALLDLPLSAHVVYHSRQPSANAVSLYDLH
jgi:hypothetical protein